MLTLMKPKVKPRILGLILGRNVAGPESPSSDSPPPTHLQAGGGGLSAAPLSTAVLRACKSITKATAGLQGFAEGFIFCACLLVSTVGIIINYSLCVRHLVYYGRRLVCMVGI